jgi:hypothetical protein
VSKDLRRRVERAAARAGPAEDEPVFAYYRAIAARVLEDPLALEPTKEYCAWLAERSGGQNLNVREMLARLDGWLRENPRGLELMWALGPFLDRAMNGDAPTGAGRG